MAELTREQAAKHLNELVWTVRNERTSTALQMGADALNDAQRLTERVAELEQGLDETMADRDVFVERARGMLAAFGGLGGSREAMDREERLTREALALAEYGLDAADQDGDRHG